MNRGYLILLSACYYLFQLAQQELAFVESNQSELGTNLQQAERIQADINQHRLQYEKYLNQYLACERREKR